MNPLIEKRGHNGTLRVYPDRVEIDRHGFWLSNLIGLHGTNTIFFSEIKSVNFKRRGLFVGWLHFNLRGNNKHPILYGFVESDTTITYLRGTPEWSNMYEYLVELIAEYKAQQPSARAFSGL